MSLFKQYLAESEKTFTYRIKTVFPITDDMQDRIERVLTKYKIIDIGRPRKTMFQSQPLEFPNIKNTEVYILDATIGMPVSSPTLQTEIMAALNVSASFIVVRGTHEAFELENDREAAKLAKGDDDKKPLLAVEAEYPAEEQTADGTNYYGDAFNSKLLGYLKGVQEERTNGGKVDAPASLFSWLDMPKESQEPAQSTENFNKDIKASTSPVKAVKGESLPVSHHGNLQDVVKVPAAPKK